MEIEEQACTCCNVLKPFSAFAKHPGGRNGLRAKCRQCANAVRMLNVDANRDRVRMLGREAAAIRRKSEEVAQKHREASTRYYRSNRDSVAAYRKKRWEEDPVFRMLAWQRMSLHRLLKGKSIGPGSRCAAMLGYSAVELREHIERQFTSGMNWSLVGPEIHIDHIIPVAKLVQEGVTDPKVIHALPNLRPMWADENRKKAAEVLTLL